MKEYGVVEPVGTQGYGAARIGLRAPRVAVRVRTGTGVNWQSMFAVAMSAASGLWGGSGFIYLPCGTERLHAALARVLTVYDPDYLVDALPTFGDAEAMEPGFLARRFRGWPEDPEDAAARFTSYLTDQVVNDRPGDDTGANLCSPFYDHDDFRSLTVLSEESDGHGVHRLRTVLGSTPHADFEIPVGLDPLLTLALGMRAGFPAKPALLLDREIDGITERLPQKYLNYVLSIRQDHRDEPFGGLTSAWSLTETGLTQVARMRLPSRPMAVIGSDAEDFALAVALDRMYGATIWVPTQWTRDQALRWPLAMGFYGLVNAARPLGRPPVITSISLRDEELAAVVRESWRPPGLVHPGEDGQLQAVDSPPQIVPADRLDLGSPKHLACAGDYDLSFSSPTRADGRGGFEFILPVPAHTPRSGDLQTAARPFWEVDVEAYPHRMPTGRNLRAGAMLAGDESYPSVTTRSGRDGIAFSPMNMLLVPAGASLEQSVARPRLKVLGLRGWIEALAAQEQPTVNVRLSQAGRRAMIITRMWESRSAVARDLLELNDFLRGFEATGSRDTDSYPDRDGVRLAPHEGYLTFAAAIRTLPHMDPAEIRDRLNHLLRINALQRGLIIPCSECERRAFYRIDLAAETINCPRCGAPAYAATAWKGSKDDNEPGWYYDLNGAVRELFAQNGDVPFLAGRALAASAQNFEDIAELDFKAANSDQPDEIDIAAVADGRVIIGEAKCTPKLGSAKEASQSIQKMIRISDLIGADEILLATTAPGPWKQTDISRLQTAVTRHKWRFGKPPRIQLMTSLRENPQKELLN